MLNFVLHLVRAISNSLISRYFFSACKFSTSIHFWLYVFWYFWILYLLWAVLYLPLTRIISIGGSLKKVLQAENFSPWRFQTVAFSLHFFHRLTLIWLILKLCLVLHKFLWWSYLFYLFINKFSTVHTIYSLIQLEVKSVMMQVSVFNDGIFFLW